jgi:hypothetical protein
LPYFRQEYVRKEKSPSTRIGDFLFIIQIGKVGQKRKYKYIEAGQRKRNKGYKESFYLFLSARHSEATREIYGFTPLRNTGKRRCETKDLCFFQKEVSISPERSKRFRKMLTSFSEKQGASTRKARVSDLQSPAVGVQKSVFVFLCSLSVR